MAGPKKMTPQRAGQLGSRWRLAMLGALAASLGFMAAGMEQGFVLAALIAVFSSSEAADHYGWRRGYVARQGEEPPRPRARLQVLRLPTEAVDGEMRKPFALVLDGIKAVSDTAVANVEAAMKEFAHDCGGRTALVSSVPIDVSDAAPGPGRESD